MSKELPSPLVIVGNPADFHVGSHFLAAARELGIVSAVCDSREAYGNSVRQKFDWWVRGKRPSQLADFNRQVLNVCKELKPRWLLSTGISPLTEDLLCELKKLGVWSVNFLTDDPWNSVHKARWFQKTLPRYDHIFSPRKANLRELSEMGCKVSYLPFAYAPSVHFAESSLESLETDVIFAGGADRDREPFITECIEEGFKLSLYGAYWDRFPIAKSHWRGHVDLKELRSATQKSSVSLCLVRRANRDGHVMRSFEVPAMGGCMLTEKTEEHLELFGEEGESVLYFESEKEMGKKLRWLLHNPHERRRLRRASHQRITEGGNTYRDRLLAILEHY